MVGLGFTSPPEFEERFPAGVEFLYYLLEYLGGWQRQPRISLLHPGQLLLLVVIIGLVLDFIVIQGVPDILAGMGNLPQKTEGLLREVDLDFLGKVQTHASTFAFEYIVQRFRG